MMHDSIDTVIEKYLESSKKTQIPLWKGSEYNYNLQIATTKPSPTKLTCFFHMAQMELVMEP